MLYKIIHSFMIVHKLFYALPVEIKGRNTSFSFFFIQTLKGTRYIFCPPSGGVTIGNRQQSSAYDACLRGASIGWAASLYL